MTQTYYGFLTDIGLAEFANAEVSGLPLPFTHIAIGDGNGSPVTPNQAMTALVHEVHRLPITSITDDPENPGLLKFECVLLPTVGGWTIRELGLIGGNGGGNKLLAVSNFPATPKPVLAEGAGADMIIRMNLIVSNTAIVQLIMDPSVVVATNQAIANAVAAHEAKANPHPQYILESERGATNGVAELVGGVLKSSQIPASLATDAELSAAMAAHLAAPDPHPQYATDADLLAVLNANDRLFRKKIWRHR
jgi:phage-related tail fiber protein